MISCRADRKAGSRPAAFRSAPRRAAGPVSSDRAPPAGMPHAVGLHPQREVQRRSRHILEVIGPVRYSWCRSNPSRRFVPSCQCSGPCECSLPPNIKCSNRCANPVLPGFSFFEPTWYHTLMATIGALWSSCTMTVRPLSKTNFWNGNVYILALGKSSRREKRGQQNNERGPNSHCSSERFRVLHSVALWKSMRILCEIGRGQTASVARCRTLQTCMYESQP